MRHKVDPAALLVAVFAVGVGPLFQPGKWYYVNTVTSAVVLLVVLAFTWPTRKSVSAEPLSLAARVAYVSVYAFVLTVVFAWPMQLVARGRVSQEICADPAFAKDVLKYAQAWDCRNRNDDALTAAGTNYGMIAGLVLFVVILIAIELLHRRYLRGDASQSRT